jgi:signal transduction histidine kinase
MSQNRPPIERETIPLREVADALRLSRPFSGVCLDALPGIQQVERIGIAAGTVLAAPGDRPLSYFLVLEGEMRAEMPEKDGTRTLLGVAKTGEGFGEVLLLIGKNDVVFFIRAARDSVLIRFTEKDFWTILASCPEARKAILADMAQRFHAHQIEALHRERLVSLGTLAAGLMHELHNPGSAAKRAASQLRQNLLRLQQLSMRFSEQPKTPAQTECVRWLLEQTLSGCHAPAMSSLQQSDAEEAMAAWLASSGVENAFKLAPSLVAIGLKQQELECAREAFHTGGFSDALNWLEALVSSVTVVCTIEESIARISDLVMAVKKFAYDERSPNRELDVHDSLQSSLTILGHKLRLKEIAVDKRFTAHPSTICTRGSSLSQVWTNLIDNAVDASPPSSPIEIATWTENGCLAVSIVDHGAGIPPAVLPHVFEAFFTTKPQGAGTGLGLEIVHRIVTQKFGGCIEVKSEPGNTRFIVRLPLEGPSAAESSEPFAP